METLSDTYSSCSIFSFADVLEQFTPAPQKQAIATPAPAASVTIEGIPPAPPPTAVTTTAATTTTTTNAISEPPIPDDDPTIVGEIPDEDIELAEKFTRELVKGMESLMRGETAAPGSAAGDNEDQSDTIRELRALWESMLVQGMDGAAFEGSSSGGLGGAEPLGQGGVAGPAKDDAFQSSIQQTMEKLRKSESNLQVRVVLCSVVSLYLVEIYFQADAAPKKPADPDTASLEALMAQLAGGAEGLGGAESEEMLHGLLESMMTQLMTKEVLYDPIKELHDKV
jgi:peroxin-19